MDPIFPNDASNLNETYYNRNRDQYLSAIEKYKGTPLYEELMQNPYISRLDYEANFFQKLGYGMFGTESPWSQHWNSRMQSAEEWMSDILQKHETRQNNSTVAQAARDAAAGINDTPTGHY